VNKVRRIAVSIPDTDLCKRLADPINKSTYHMEVMLPFSEAVKLEKGNANVRPFNERKQPFKDMLDTVEDEPESFHLRNRGITYLCDSFEFDNRDRMLTIGIPDLQKSDGDDAPKFGIADGGHTYEIVRRTTEKLSDYREKEGWIEPFVRVHFVSGEASQAAAEKMVEALNTSSQVRQYSLEEFRGEFDELKDALEVGGFDTKLIAFRENENKPWEVLEVIQRLACFLKARWQQAGIPPTRMYRSKTEALDLYLGKDSRKEFQQLYAVINDVLTLPELIQSKLSVLEDRRPGKVVGVKKLDAPTARPGTSFPSRLKFDMSALLPMAAAFRELLVLRGDRYQWRIAPGEMLTACLEPLYNAFLKRRAKAKLFSHIGIDPDYWTSCDQVVTKALLDRLS
jgi:hypothetical protein